MSTPVRSLEAPALTAESLAPPSLEPSSRNTRGALTSLGLAVAGIVTWLTLWELAATQHWSLFFRFENVPAPSEVFRATGELLESPKFASHVWSSVRRVFVGFAVASTLAVGLGLVIGRFRAAAQSMLPPLELLRPIPAVAWIPIAILLFPSSERSMVFITFIGAFFPVLLNTIHGVEHVDARLINAARSLGANQFDVFREVILPAALPSIVAGFSIGMGTSWFSLVTAEMISGQFGIGYYTWESYTLQKYPSIVLGMLAIGVLGMGSTLLIKRIARSFMPWSQPENSR
ncbi:MAG: ABC transporter permease [Polyangiaceae bacterium]